MNKSEQTKISKFLSYVLRHKPDAIGLQLDSNGWADIDELISKANDSGELEALSIEQLKEVVADSENRDLLFLMRITRSEPTKATPSRSIYS